MTTEPTYRNKSGHVQFVSDAEEAALAVLLSKTRKTPDELLTVAVREALLAAQSAYRTQESLPSWAKSGRTVPSEELAEMFAAIVADARDAVEAKAFDAVLAVNNATNRDKLRAIARSFVGQYIPIGKFNSDGRATIKNLRWALKDGRTVTISECVITVSGTPKVDKTESTE